MTSFSPNVSKPLLLALLCVWGLSACSDDTANTPQVPAKPLPEPGSVGVALLEKYCSDCHREPHPSTHTKNEWKSVVLRMNQHRVTRGYHSPSDSETTTLIEYLEKHASG